MIKFIFGISLTLLIVPFGGNKLVTFLRSPGLLLDFFSLGKNGGLITELSGIKEFLSAAINFKSDGGKAVLTEAVLNENIPLDEFLLKSGVDSSREDYGRPILSWTFKIR